MRIFVGTPHQRMTLATSSTSKQATRRRLRPSKKLDLRFAGPYRITGVTKSAYRLNLPASLQIDNVFSADLLRPAARDPLPEQHEPLPPPIALQLLDLGLVFLDQNRRSSAYAEEEQEEEAWPP